MNKPYSLKTSVTDHDYTIKSDKAALTESSFTTADSCQQIETRNEHTCGQLMFAEPSNN